MCQRASGNAFAPLIEVATDRVRWTGTPATWTSSNIAERGFCAGCGTPLFYRQTGRTTIEFMAGSLDRPEDYDPAANHGTESRLPWLARLAALPSRETTLAPGTTLVSHQSETQ
jgi:hypothetical protein